MWLTPARVAIVGSLAECRNGWLGRKESNLDMAISKSDALAYPRGVTEPHCIRIEQAPRNTRISRTVPNSQSPELWREMIHSEKNGRTLPIRGPEFKSEIAASIGLNYQHPRAENRRLQRRWRSEWDSNAGSPQILSPGSRNCVLLGNGTGNIAINSVAEFFDSIHVSFDI